ncbi:bacillithiol biosynthesis cysteine-adding enzyme BshC [Paenibacillus sanguinis]|uniref:bacillithiol biosynthesis cysteine-adding enzyme BshC n=1 Tax=Paenibacillus sanguinis TaxID=225906 RepID=UPI00036AD8D8|nr:bacillithiol biosynthesis cysteine-adding enzyme BshC [Paenibacillus sanguinis]
MNVVQEQLSSAQPLAEVYVNQFSAVELLYESDPAQSASWSKRAAWLDESEHTRIGRIELAAYLREYNRRFNPHPAVEQAISDLEQPGAAVIVGGQQSGLFTGPLLVIYKALTVIKAAKKASADLKRPVVPVFWIAGEDHDWDEVNHSYFLSPELQVRRIRVHRDAVDRRPVSYTNVSPEDWQQAVAELEQQLPDSEFKAELLAMLHQLQGKQASSLSEMFARLMGNLFGKYGLILMDSADPKLRRLELPVFEAIIAQNDELEGAYFNAVRDMAELGYSPAAEVSENGANLFYVDGHERRLLFKQSGRYSDRKRKVSFSQEELLSELRKYPERFSNNVLTRPLMQDSVLPVLAAVLGPGEISYWALTRRAFRKLGLRMPLLLPRESFTVIEPTVQKYMNKYGIKWNDVKEREDFRQKREAWLSAQDELQTDPRFDEVIRAFADMYNPLIEQLSGIDTGLHKLGVVNRDKIIEQMNYLRGKTKDALARNHDTGLRHFDRIELSLFPLNKPQERVYNIFYYLNRFGLDWIDDLMDISYNETGKHRIIYL